MEDDVDIYADLPSFSLNSEKNDQNCKCKELKKELSSLVSQLENVQKINTNLEYNLSSLLKTAKAEIGRKDKMIDDLRRQLDNVAFRRGNKNENPDFSTHRLPQRQTITRKHENVSSTQPQESETELHQVQFHHDENKSRKPQTDVNRIPTLFGERLQKRIMEDEKEEKKQKESLKLSIETKAKDIPKNDLLSVVENNKENGSQFSVNNNGNESNVERCSNSEIPETNSYKKKRTNEEDDKCKHKRLKIENNEDKITTEETDFNSLTRYDLVDNSAQYEIKDFVKFEDRSGIEHSLKKVDISFCTERKAASEYQDTKQDQSCTNGWRNDARNNSTRDYENSNIRNDLADSLKNSRTITASNYVSEGFNSGYKRNRYRYSPPRSYSRSRSDYENVSSHRKSSLRERFSRTYREKKYDDYKYDSRYKNERLRRNYESEERDGKTRYTRGERGVLRARSRYSSSDTEDRESSSTYKNKKYENRKDKKETANILRDKKLHESNKTVTETRKSSSRTIVNNTNYSAEKNIEQHKAKNEPEIKCNNSIKNTSVYVAIKNLDILEEGEILDSPEKKDNSAKVSKDNKMEENNVKNDPIENKNEDISVNVSMSLQNDSNNKKQLEVMDISTKEIEIISHLLQENSKDCAQIIELNSSKSDMAEDTCKSYINGNLVKSTAQNTAIEQMRESDINGNDKNNTDTTSKDFITETITVIETAKIKEMTASNIENITKIKELDDSSIESATKKEEINNENVVETIEVNNFNNNDIHKIDGDELKTSTAEVITKVEAILNCDIEDRDKSQTPIENETLSQMSNKSNAEICLDDHNYVQKPFINVSDLDAIQKPSRSECDEIVPETTTPKETKAEKTISVQLVNGIKRTMSSIMKNKKDQQSKGILISRRRKAVILSDSNASMTVLMNMNIAKTSTVNNCNDNDATSKPRACKISRVTAKTTCK